MQDTAGEAEMYSYGPPHMAVQKQDDQHEHTFSSYVKIRDVVLKTCLGQWTIGRSGERGSGMSVLPARDDDDVRKKCSTFQNISKTNTSKVDYFITAHMEAVVECIRTKSRLGGKILWEVSVVRVKKELTRK